MAVATWAEDVLAEKRAHLIERGFSSCQANGLISEAVKALQTPKAVVCYKHHFPPGMFSGLGAVTDDLAKAAQLEPVKAAREAVSPWLWVLSLFSFGMALMNTRRIGRLYSKWYPKRSR